MIIIARDDEGAARAVASGFKYVIPTPFTFNVPVVKQNVPAPPVPANGATPAPPTAPEPPPPPQERISDGPP